MANPYGPYSTSNMLGANFEQTYAPEATDPYQAGPPFALGQSALGTDNTTWVFGVASGAVAAGTCTVDANFTVTDAAGNYTAPVAIASGYYGWVRKTTSPL